MKLVVLNGGLQGREFRLDKPEMVLGRRASSDVYVGLDQRVSRSHARVFQSEGNWFVEDLGSANGTFLGERRVHGPQPLRPGDRLRIGRTWIEVVPDAVAATEQDAASLVFFTNEDAPPPDSDILMQVQTAPSLPAAADADLLRRRLLVLTQVAETLGSTLEVTDLLGRIVDYILEVVPAERGLLLLRDEQGELRAKVIRLRTGTPADQDVIVSRHIAERALSEGVTILAEDALADQRFSDAGSVHDLSIRSAICAPLIHRGNRLGVIYLDTTSATEVFGPDSVDLINSIAPQCAAALTNAELYTELRAAYDDIRHSQEQLLQSEKLSTIGTLATSIAHDMANIVTPLGALVARLQKNGSLSDLDREMVAQQIQRLNAMVRRITSFGRPQAQLPEAVDVNEVVTSTVSMIETDALNRHIDLVTNLALGNPTVMADPSGLQQALLNLILNALDACSAGQKVVVSTGVEHGDVSIAVADNGPGIPLELQPHLFEPFFTTKKQGTGLGLYSVRRIVQQELGGEVQIDSTEGEGTTVCMILSAAPPKSQGES